MMPEQEVVSLDLSKKLKELGAPQESQLYWEIPRDQRRIHNGAIPLVNELPGKENVRNRFFDYYSAFTAAELRELLPPSIPLYKDSLDSADLRITREYNSSTKTINEWCCWYQRPDNGSALIEQFGGSSMTDALAKMLIYLLENRLLAI
jgi:hypothetical protein